MRLLRRTRVDNDMSSDVLATCSVLPLRKFYMYLIVLAIIFLLVAYPLTTVSRESEEISMFNFRDFTEPSVLDIPELRQFCEHEVEWQENIYLDCYNIPMGAFNAINKLHVCIRWALDAGIGFVIPTFMTRDDNDILKLGSDNSRAPIEYLLDEQFLFKALRKNCPQLKIVKKENFTKINELIGEMGRVKFTPGLNFRKGKYRNYIHQLIQNNTKSNNETNDLPILVKEADSLGAWDVWSDSVEFQLAFHNLVRFSKPLVRIAQGILEKLPYTYYGLHMRVEKDWPFVPGTPTEAEMAKLPLAHSKTNNPVMYTACGDVDKLQEFKRLAHQHNVIVVDKWDLVDGEDKEMLDKLHFDQMGIVDYIVLSHAEFFWGIGGSSFSQSLGLWRHIYQFKNLYYVNQDQQSVLLGPRDIQEPMFKFLW